MKPDFSVEQLFSRVKQLETALHTTNNHLTKIYARLGELEAANAPVPEGTRASAVEVPRIARVDPFDLRGD